MHIMKFYDVACVEHQVKTNPRRGRHTQYPSPAQADVLALRYGWCKDKPVVVRGIVKHFGATAGQLVVK